MIRQLFVARSATGDCSKLVPEEEEFCSEVYTAWLDVQSFDAVCYLLLDLLGEVGTLQVFL